MEQTRFGVEFGFECCLDVVGEGQHVVRFCRMLTGVVRRISWFALERLTTGLMFLTYLQGIMLLYTISKQQLHPK